MQQVTVPGYLSSASASMPHQRNSKTSTASAIDAQPRAGTNGARVYAFVAARGADGATDEEMQLGLPMTGNTQRPRRVVLTKAMLLKDSGRTRKSLSGHQSTVWVLAEIE